LRLPERTCLGCGRKRPQKELIRLVLGCEGQLVADGDPRGKGRGAYLCGTGCWSAACKKKVFHRAFRGKLKRLDLTSLEAALAGMRVRYGEETRS